MSKGKILGVIIVFLILVSVLGWYFGTSEDGKFSDWSKCTKECGTGIQTRTYTPKVNNGDDLPDKDIIEQSCNTQPCVIDGKYNKWSEWGSCVKSQTDNTSINCGPGKQKRIRSYSQPINGGDPHPDYLGVNNTDIENKLIEWQDCIHSTIPNCPINGSYNNWSEYGTCVTSQTDSTPITCGTGKKSRTRTYNAPLHRGSHHPDYTAGKTDLENKLIEWETCTHPSAPNCPINGSYSEWITQAGCVKLSTDETPITCVSSTIPGVQKKTRTYNAPLHEGRHHTDYTVGKTDLENKLIEWEICSNISRVCQPQNASCSSWTNDGNPFCNTTSNQYQIKQKRTYIPARDGGADLTNTPDNDLCKTRLSHERTILARSDANIALSEGVCPANGIMTAFSTPIDSNCTPATGKNRVQYLVATYTFPTSSTNTHDSNFTALGFSTSEINNIKNLTTTSSPSELTINANNIEYKIKRTNTTFPYIYEIKKKVSCSDVYTFSPSQINAAWKQATGCTQDLNTTIYSQINTTEDNLRYLNSIENDVKPKFNTFTANSLIQTKNTQKIKLCYGDNNNTGYVTVNNNDNDKAQYTAGSIFPPGIKIAATNIAIVHNSDYRLLITGEGELMHVKLTNWNDKLFNPNYTKSNFGYIVMEHGGNLVIFNNQNPSNILWQSGTGNNNGAYLELESNGALIIKKKDSSGAVTIIKYLYITSSIQDSTWTSTTGCTQPLDNNILTTLNSSRSALNVLDSLTSLANVFNPFTAGSLISNKDTDKIKLCYGDNNNTGYVTVNTTNKSNYTARAIFPPGIRITATDIAIVENTTYKYMIESSGRFGLFNKSNSQTYLISPTYTGSNFGSLVMEHGGNLVIFSNTSSSSILWSSGTGTSGNSGAYLELESNGSLIIKKRDSSGVVTNVKILYSNGLMTVNGSPSNFPAKLESLCTPAYGDKRTQNVTVNYTFPTIENGSHDDNFTAIGFSATQIAAITNLPLNDSTSYDITVSSTTNRYTIKRTNNTEPKTYEITKTLICEYVPPLPKNWKNYDYSTNNRCGPDEKNTACPDNKCCSSLGYCGGTTGDNGAHCYTVLGWNGFYNDKTPVLPKNWDNINHSTTFIENGSRRCGPDYGSCPNEQCCSSAGYCGGTTGENDDYCGTALSGGKFNSKEPKNWKGNIYSTTVESGGRRCGPDFNNTACLGNQCCSSAGYCGGATGANDAYCSTSKSNGEFNHKEPTGRCTPGGIWGTQTVYNGNVISMTCPDGTTKTATCNNGGWKDIGKCPKYIFRTYASNGTLNTYVMPNDGIHWEEAVAGRNKDNAVETLNYNGGTNRDGNRGDGIEFRNNSSTVFANSSNEDSQNSYGKTGTNKSTAVYDLTAPNGYTKESKYLYRYQSGPDYVYAVFKNDNW